MSILLNGLPYTIEIDGEGYGINADYKTCLTIIMAFEDSELTKAEKMNLLLQLLYKTVPQNIETAIKKGVLFLNCGDEDDNGSSNNASRLYSFAHDDKYIFSGIDRVLNGRLSKGEFVHWWEFVMAFMELPEDCTMSKIIYFRSRYAKNKLTKEERKIYAENRDLFELPQKLTADEQAAHDEFMSLLGK